MNKIIYSIPLVFLFSISYAQVENILVKDFDVLPRAMEGQRDPKLIIQQNLRYPEIAAEKGLIGQVIVSFIIKPNGEIRDINVVNEVHPTLDNESVRVIKLTNGHWISGKKNGQKVDSYFEMPVVFNLVDVNINNGYYLKSAEKYLKKSKYIKALECLEEIRKREPYNYDNISKLASSYKHIGKLDLACKYWKRLKFLNQEVDDEELSNCIN